MAGHVSADPPIRYVPVNLYNMRRLDAIDKTGRTLPGCTSCKQALYDAFVAAGWIEHHPGAGQGTEIPVGTYRLTDLGQSTLEEWRTTASGGAT